MESTKYWALAFRIALDRSENAVVGQRLAEYENALSLAKANLRRLRRAKVDPDALATSVQKLTPSLREYVEQTLFGDTQDLNLSAETARTRYRRAVQILKETA